MFLLRRLLVITMLAVAGSGSMPLWLHQVLHHSDCQLADKGIDGASTKTSCGCVHVRQSTTCPVSTSDSQAMRFTDQSSAHHCAACFQLSQTSSPIYQASAGHTPLASGWYSGENYLSWNIRIPCSHPPRGPPAELHTER